MNGIDFQNPKPQIISHPQYDELHGTILNGLKDFDLSDHFILFSSGTTGGSLKGYAISKRALFANAKAVNEHFALRSDDVWGLSLPSYHIGGLSVLARAHLLGNKVIDLRKWAPLSWAKKLEDVTITTIVPTQLYDLVKLGIKAPKNLRYIIVGGDFLSSELKKRAMDLGWPVIRTFGMSEVCSQLASSRTPRDDELEILPIHQVKTNSDSRLLVKSDALFTLEFKLNEILTVKHASELALDGYYITSDRVVISGKFIKHLGRMGDEIKISGHLVNLLDLKNVLENYLIEENNFGQMELVIEADARKGKKITLLTLPGLESHILRVKELLLPVKIDEVRVVESFTRTDLGKLKKNSI